MTRRRQAKFARVLPAPLFAAVLCASLPSLAAGVSVAQATSSQHKLADKKLAEGHKLFKAGKLDKALVAFEEAHRIVENPEARLMAARAHQNLGELVKAHAEYTAAVAEGEAAVKHNEKYRNTLQAAQKELKELEGVVARLTIKLRYAPSGTSVVLDGEPLASDKLGVPLLLSPGALELIATAPDGREVSRKLTLTAGQNANVELAFTRDRSGDVTPEVVEDGVETPPASEPGQAASTGNGKRTAAFVAGGVGVAGLAMFGVFGAMSNSRYNELDEACVDARCTPDHQSDIDDGKRYQTLANVGLAVGAVGIGASATLFLLSSSKSPDKQTDRGDRAGVELGIGFGSILVRGRFQ